MLSVALAVPTFSQADDNAQQKGSDQNSAQSDNSSSQTSNSNQASESSSGKNQVAQVSKEGRDSIKKVQDKLKHRGYYDGKVDGVWGPKSTAALKKYQQDKDIQASGTMDEKTADKLGLNKSEFSAFEEAVGQQSGAQGSNPQSQGSGSQGSGQNSNQSGSSNSPSEQQNPSGQ
jgi:N-acetylmuramoyl-L-alanine amidase